MVRCHNSPSRGHSDRSTRYRCRDCEGGEAIEPYRDQGKAGQFTYAIYNNSWLSPQTKGDAQVITRVAITGIISGHDGEIVIPSSLDGHEVYGIDDRALELDQRLRAITIPKTVRFLSPGILNRSQSLASIAIADDHPDFASLDGVMFDKQKTTLPAYPAGRRGEYKFPETTTAIGPAAFSLSRNLKNLTIPASVTDIGGDSGGVFLGCINLERIDLPETVTNIGQKSFQDCERLQEVTISPKVTCREWHNMERQDAHGHSATMQVPVEIHCSPPVIAFNARYLADALDIGSTLYLSDELSPGICRHPTGRFCVIMPMRVNIPAGTGVETGEVPSHAQAA